MKRSVVLLLFIVSMFVLGGMVFAKIAAPSIQSGELQVKPVNPAQEAGPHTPPNINIIITNTCGVNWVIRIVSYNNAFWNKPVPPGNATVSFPVPMGEGYKLERWYMGAKIDSKDLGVLYKDSPFSVGDYEAKMNVSCKYIGPNDPNNPIPAVPPARVDLYELITNPMSVNYIISKDAPALFDLKIGKNYLFRGISKDVYPFPITNMGVQYDRLTGWSHQLNVQKKWDVREIGLEWDPFELNYNNECIEISEELNPSDTTLPVTEGSTTPQISVGSITDSISKSASAMDAKAMSKQIEQKINRILLKR